MEEIKVGEYVRFQNGIIKKVYKVEKVDLYAAVEGLKFGTKKDGFELWIYFSADDYPLRLEPNEELRLKHSPNIIDLIEEGDYVNGTEVIEVRKQNNKIYLMTSYVPQKFIKEDIKSIVTKEQFEQRKYIVGDE